SPMFDWRQLQKWSISESRLPQGSTVQFKQPTFWEEYKWYAIGLTTAVTVETLLIVFLIYLRVRRRQAENEAKQLSSRLSEIVSNVPGIVWESRAVEGQNQRTTTFISDYVQKMLGYSPDEWLKQPPGFGLDLVPEEERERVLRESDAVIESGQEGVSEFRWKTKDGQIRWIENYLSPLVDGDSSIVGLRGVALDVTDRKLAENRLRESELFNRAILSSLNTHVCVLDGDGRIISVNYSWAAFALDNGLPSEVSVGPGVNYFDVCRRAVIEGDKLAQSALDGVRAVCDGSLENFHLEYPCHSPDEKRWFLMIVTPLKDSKGGAVVVHNDITSSKLAAEAVRESEKRFRNMAENAPVIIWISDEEQSTTYLNKYWMEFTGSKLEKETGLEWTRHVHSDDRAPALEIYNDAFERREPFELEFRARRVDGEYRWIASSGAPRFTPEGQFLGYIGTGVDITERKESEGALKQAHEELKKLKAKLEAENIYLQEELRQDQAFGDIVGQSDAIKYVLYKVGQVAPIDSTVLISGETGTGKELVARAIHEASQRKSRPLIKVNCAALTSSLIESELFGHEKGAFTGAGARKLGRFELANRGTLLLDEIGELPLDLQSKLLRVLQEGEFERVGSGNTIKTDVRIIASTNRDLRQAVEKGTFREDLWYRLNVFPITTPPLRERRDDIPLLTEHFGRTFARKFGKELTAVSPETMTALCMYSWPGNVRELANVIERAVINLHGTVLKIREDFPIQQAESLAASVKTLDAMEREHIVRVLDDLNWRIDGPKGAARILGINASTLRTRMVKLGIHKPNGHNPSSMIEN
ncbi:MAG: sigma 54-interacting transcriptional regulator, partial [Pyrinomonadaceae bacterium]